MTAAAAGRGRARAPFRHGRPALASCRRLHPAAAAAGVSGTRRGTDRPEFEPCRKTLDAADSSKGSTSGLAKARKSHGHPRLPVLPKRRPSPRRRGAGTAPAGAGGEAWT